MAVETEQKFLLAYLPDLTLSERQIVMKQGYFDCAQGTTVRVRLADQQAFLNIKGAPTSLLSRPEFEYEIPFSDGEELLKLFCADRIVEKVRYHIRYQGFLWEVDLFSGRHQGLTLAEIELDSPDDSYPLPPWIGREVTHDRQYSNHALASGGNVPAS